MSKRHGSQPPSLDEQRQIKSIEGVLKKLSPTARDDVMAVILLEQAARNPGLKIPPDMTQLLADFMRRAGIPTHGNSEQIWSAIDRYLAASPLDAAAVNDLKLKLENLP